MSASARRLEKESKREIWDLRWIREPLQDRSERTRAKLLDATVQLLEHEGVDGLTIAKIAKLAGCSVGSFYHHFQDKRAAVYAVLDRAAHERILTAAEGLRPDRWEGVPLLGILEGYVRFTLKMAKRHPGVLHARLRLSMEDPEVDRRTRANEKEKFELILQLLETRGAEVNAPDPKLALRMVLELLSAMLERRSQAALPGGRSIAPRLSEEAFVAEVMQMARGYLGMQAAP